MSASRPASREVLSSEVEHTHISGEGDIKIKASHRQPLFIRGGMSGSGRRTLIGFGDVHLWGSVEGSGETALVNCGAVQLRQFSASGDLLLVDTPATIELHAGSGRIRYKGIKPTVREVKPGAGAIKEDKWLEATDF